MALETKLQLKQMQKLVMTTELRNAIKLLTLSRLELQQLVQQKLLEMAEEKAGEEEKDEDGLPSAEADQDGEDSPEEEDTSE